MLEYLKKRLPSLIIFLIVTFVVFTILSSDRAVKDDTTLKSQVELQEVKLLVKDFVLLDSSIVSTKDEPTIEKLREVITPRLYEDYFMSADRFMSLPDIADKMKCTVDYLIAEYNTTNDSYTCIGVLSETSKVRTYQSTFIVDVTKDKKINSYIKIPHLK